MPTKLTPVFVDKLKKGTKFDALATGLGLRVLGSGKKVWIFQTIFPGYSVQARRTIGPYPGISLADARKEAERWRALVKRGVDPKDAIADELKAIDAKRRAEALKNSNTFGSFAEKYIAGRTNKRARMDDLEIRRLLIPAWCDKPIAEIAPRDVRELINKIKVKPFNARTAWGHAVLIFKQAVFEEVIPVSPCASLDRRMLFKGVKLEHRQRMLTDDEIFALWHAAEKEEAGAFYKLLLLTGVRAGELAGAAWSEINLKARRWVIPRERFKSDSEHIVPLTDAAIEILESLPRAANSDGLFMVNCRTVEVKARLDAGMLKILKDRADGPVKLPGWVAHDTRRTVRSNLSALEVPEHVAEMVIGHGRKGLARVYDQHRYEPQIRQALEAWADRVSVIVGLTPAPRTNVITLNRK